MATVREMVETTLGVMAMTRQCCPRCARGGRVIVNVTSSATLRRCRWRPHIPQAKWLSEASRGRWRRARNVNVRVKLVEPGYGPTTRFTSNVGSRMEGLFPEAYAAFANPILASFAQVTTVTTESDVAEAVYRAANDVSGRLRFPAGPDAVALAQSALSKSA